MMNNYSELKERVKSEVDIAGYIIRSGVPLKGGPVEYKACCPLHNEKSPSFTVNVEKRLFHCFGCGAGGDIFEYEMRTGNVDFVRALKKIANSVGIAVPERLYEPRETRVNEHSSADL